MTMKKTKQVNPFSVKHQRVKITLKKRPEGVRQPDAAKHRTAKAPKVRASLVPGAVCILLAGPYKGKRAVVLKTLVSGNLVVSGPFLVNGLPLRRVNPRFVIGTSTRVPAEIISKLNLSKFDDAYFNKPKKSSTQRLKSKKEDGGIFMSQDEREKRPVVSDARKADQNGIDSALIAYLNQPANALLKQYLKTRFSLSSGVYPHKLKF